MYPFATDLVEHDPLPDEDEVARYCKPIDYDHDTRSPKVTAFIRRASEDDLSVNRLQFFHDQVREDAVACIRHEVGAHYELKATGRFVVLGASAAKTAALKRACKISIVYTPKPSRPSHASIFGLPDNYDDEVRVATALIRLITRNDTYYAVLP